MTRDDLEEKLTEEFYPVVLLVSEGDMPGFPEHTTVSATLHAQARVTATGATPEIAYRMARAALEEATRDE